MNGSGLVSRTNTIARGHVEQLVYERGVKDGLARTPAAMDPSLAGAAPSLANAYTDGYQWGARHRPRLPALLDRLGLRRRS
jgi:hypothetical protein